MTHVVHGSIAVTSAFHPAMTPGTIDHYANYLLYGFPAQPLSVDGCMPTMFMSSGLAKVPLGRYAASFPACSASRFCRSLSTNASLHLASASSFFLCSFASSSYMPSAIMHDKHKQHCRETGRAEASYGNWKHLRLECSLFLKPTPIDFPLILLNFHSSPLRTHLLKLELLCQLQVSLTVSWRKNNYLFMAVPRPLALRKFPKKYLFHRLHHPLREIFLFLFF